MTGESMIAAGTAATQDSEKMVPQRDLDRLRSVLDSRNSKTENALKAEQRARQIAEKNWKDAEQQVENILTKAKENYKKSLTPQEQLEYDLQEERRTNQRLKSEQLQSEKQAKFERWRDANLKKYKLSGDEEGLVWDKGPSKWLESVIATRAALVVQQRLNAHEQDKRTTTAAEEHARKVVEGQRATPNRNADIDRLRPPKVETRGATAHSTPSGELDDETIRSLTWEMTKGKDMKKRAEATEKLRQLRGAVN